MKHSKTDLLNLSHQKNSNSKSKGLEDWNCYLRRLYLEFSDNGKSKEEFSN